MNLHLRDANIELHEITAQNEELLQIQDHLNLLNSSLEKEVTELLRSGGKLDSELNAALPLLMTAASCSPTTWPDFDN